MRENIKDLKLGEIYDDYVQLKAMDEKYRYCSNSSVFCQPPTNELSAIVI